MLVNQRVPLMTNPPSSPSKSSSSAKAHKQICEQKKTCCAPVCCSKSGQHSLLKVGTPVLKVQNGVGLHPFLLYPDRHLAMLHPKRYAHEYMQGAGCLACP